MKPPLHLLFVRTPAPERRCCDDGRYAAATVVRPAWAVRWPRKLARAATTSTRVFRAQLGAPVAPPISIGTSVRSTTGRRLGAIRGIVVEIDSGRPAYAVAPEADAAPVLLVPRDVVHPLADEAVIDERILGGLQRRSA